MTLHAHNAHEAGQAIHMQAAPSQAEALMHEFKAKKAAAANRSKVTPHLCAFLAIEFSCLAALLDSEPCSA